MQERVQRVSLSAESKSNRQDSTSKLLETAVNMIKNGVTPDVIEFVDSTNAEINDSVLVAIQSEHDIDQAYINSLCAAFETALQSLEDRAAEIAGHDTNRLSATEAHHSCRADEAFKCSNSRRCEEQLREKWRIVKREETIMREIHWSIHDEWCVHPPYFAEIPAWLTNPFNWADMSPYPVLQIPADVVDFRAVSVTLFESYMEQKIIVEHAWEVYRERLIECSELETIWEDAIEPCDQAQITMREHACSHAIANREAREAFGQEWDRIVRLFNDALVAKTANEVDRKAEWETLKIVQCLLDHVHSEVVTSIGTGGPCPTIDSDPDGVTLAITDCHIVTRGCGPESLTAHLCLDWCEIPDTPPLPPVEEQACTPEYVAREQAQFLADIQTAYAARLRAPDTVYPDDHLVDYETVLSPAGWAGCAPPLLCVDCAGLSTVLPVPTYVTLSHVCHLHEEYLSPGQSNSDTFRCLDGGCVSMAGRCNVMDNCGDSSDELGCDANEEVFVPAYLTQSYDCPADMHADVHFQCGNSRCIDKVGMCNGHDNCGDNSDEAHCTGSIQVSVEATSGRSITVESLQMHTGVFHDREYNFDSLGHFVGKTFIKYSNDDKHTDHEHVMTKLRTVEPLTIFIVKLDGHSLPWLQAQGFSRTVYTGVSFSGIRETRHKEWDTSLLTTDHFSASAVWSKTFEAGTISIPGNNGGDGSFLMFLDRPGACDAMSHMMVQGCLNSPRDLEPDCNLADVRCCTMDGTSCNSGSFPQTYTFLDGLVSDGTACEAGACDGVANTWCHSAVSFGQAQEICAATGERLCSRAEIEDDVCCGTGCSHNSHLIWFSDELPPAPEDQCNGRYEAEAAIMHGGQVELDHDGFTGSGFFNYLNPTGDYIEWSLPSCSGGEATLHFRYALEGTDRPLQVLLNGVIVEASLSFPPSGVWTVYRRTALTVTLRAGANTVRLLAAGASGANVDSLLVLSGTPSYFIADYGAASCPTTAQAVETREACVEAHSQLELEYEPTWDGARSDIPDGCSTRETNWGGQHHFHFDTSMGNGNSRADLAPVCHV